MPLSTGLHCYSRRTFRRRSRSLPEALASKTMPLLKDSDRLPCARGGEARDAARSTTMLSSAVQYPTPEQRASCVTTIKRSGHLVIRIPLCSCLYPVLCTAVPASECTPCRNRNSASMTAEGSSTSVAAPPAVPKTKRTYSAPSPARRVSDGHHHRAHASCTLLTPRVATGCPNLWCAGLRARRQSAPAPCPAPALASLGAACLPAGPRGRTSWAAYTTALLT